MTATHRACRTPSLARSPMGLGLAALGRPGYINIDHAEDLGGHTDPRSMEARAHAVLDAAYSGGVRYFDAARSYGKAEAFLGSWLRDRQIDPVQITVASKWGYTYTANWRVDADVHEVKDLSLATLRRQERETRELLGSYRRLYQIHSATLESGVLEDKAVLDELARLRSSGLSIGLTVSGAQQAKAVERALEVGGFDAVQATWNLLDPSAGFSLSRAHDAGLTVIVKEALANGRLTARGDVPLLLETAQSKGVTPDVLALAVALAQPFSDVVLSGATTVPMLKSNLRAIDLTPDRELMSHLEAIREEPSTYWQTRAALAWN